jgi:hypothetical protein
MLGLIDRLGGRWRELEGRALTLLVLRRIVASGDRGIGVASQGLTHTVAENLGRAGIW